MKEHGKLMRNQNGPKHYKWRVISIFTNILIPNLIAIPCQNEVERQTKIISLTTSNSSGPSNTFRLKPGGGGVLSGKVGTGPGPDSVPF